MSQTFISILSCAGLFIGMILLFIGGRRLSQRRLKEQENIEGTGALTAGVFGLLGLLIAFTFNGAFSRFDSRRQLAVQQANAVGTAYLRVDLIPEANQEPIREQFQKYVAKRLLLYELSTDLESALVQVDSVFAIQQKIWLRAVEASRTEPEVARLLLPSINEMIDITTTQVVAFDTHPPLLVWVVLFVVSLASALFVGYTANPNKPLSRIHVIGFAATVSLTLYVILDVEYPQSGLIRLEYLKFLLEDLAEQMKQVSY